MGPKTKLALEDLKDEEDLTVSVLKEAAEEKMDNLARQAQNIKKQEADLPPMSLKENYNKAKAELEASRKAYKEDIQAVREATAEILKGGGSDPVQQFLALMYAWLKALDMGRSPMIGDFGGFCSEVGAGLGNFGRDIAVKTMDAGEYIVEKTQDVASVGKGAYNAAAETIFGKKKPETTDPESSAPKYKN